MGLEIKKKIKNFAVGLENVYRCFSTGTKFFFIKLGQSQNFPHKGAVLKRCCAKCAKKFFFEISLTQGFCSGFGKFEKKKKNFMQTLHKNIFTLHLFNLTPHDS